MTHQPTTQDTKSFFGFWIYLMTDLVLFASLFAVFAVLRGNTFGGPSVGQIFSAPFVLAETLLLLTSSFTCGLALLAAHKGLYRAVLLSLGATFVLGAAFVYMEVSEFAHLVASGNGWQRSGFLSSYFALVGTHGLHVLVGLLWVAALAVAVVLRGLSQSNVRKLMLFGIFWHFLDIVWIFIFTVVYLIAHI